MEVTETLSDGLKREFQVKIPAPDLEARVSQRLDELKGQVQLRGFRPGKVPVAHLKKLYGRSVMAETIEAVIREINSKIVEDRGLKLAMEPKVTLPEDEAEVEKVIGGKSDLAYTLALEVLPKIELADFKGITLERMVAEVTDAEIEEALGKIAEQNRPFAPKGEGAKVESGDRVMIDFTGTLDGAAVRGRERRRHRRQRRLQHLHPGLRGSAHRHGRGREAAGQGDVPGQLHERGTWPGRPPNSTSRRSRSRRPGRSPSTMPSPSRWAWNRSTSSRRR